MTYHDDVLQRTFALGVDDESVLRISSERRVTKKLQNLTACALPPSTTLMMTAPILVPLLFRWRRGAAEQRAKHACACHELPATLTTARMRLTPGASDCRPRRSLSPPWCSIPRASSGVWRNSAGAPRHQKISFVSKWFKPHTHFFAAAVSHADNVLDDEVHLVLQPLQVHMTESQDGAPLLQCCCIGSGFCCLCTPSSILRGLRCHHIVLILPSPRTLQFP